MLAPSAPVVRVAATSSDWLQLQWSTSDNGGSAIRGYFLNFRKEEGGEWEERAIQRDATFFRLHKLDCGTQYQLQMMAYNAVGSGSPSSVVIAHTDGDIPIKPTYLDFIEVNTSNITLRLRSWGDNGCPIISYSIEYKESSQQDWLTAGNNMQIKDSHTIIGLWPGTKYNLRVTATNKAGASTVEYSAATLPIIGVPWRYKASVVTVNYSGNPTQDVYLDKSVKLGHLRKDCIAL
uniref:Fibronectin type-III domain-containing protein n=1 Tax=Timema shepardi TaxID=629360 RepID=A0A7R9FWX9_TIMSH|nr:unnamed protein product [Timema shepardi]